MICDLIAPDRGFFVFESGIQLPKYVSKLKGIFLNLPC